MKTKTLAVLAAAAMLTACATRGTGYSPIVDLGGGGYVSSEEFARYDKDLAECRGFAAQANSAAGTALAGAVVGALLGAAIAPRGYRNNLAGQGALMGAAAGGAEGVLTQETIIKRCLNGRGYRVLH